MSDFFMPNQEEEKKEYNTNINTPDPQNNNARDYNQIANNYKAQKREHYVNAEEYGVELPDGYYEAFKPILANAKTQEERQEIAYKLGTAAKYSELMGEPIWDALQNVDAYNRANFPNLQNQKSFFEATRDMIAVGQNNVKLGKLGNDLKQAHGNNDTELANALMKEIDAINQRNATLQEHIPDRWWKEAVEAGAPSIPFTGYVAGAGIIGNFIAPIAGTGASFAVSSYLSAGTEYIDMIANGSTPQTARALSDVSGIFQGIIEADLGITKGLVKGSAKLIGKEAAEKAAKKTLEEIGQKAFKRFHFGPAKKLITNFILNYGKNVVGEGVEEAAQNVVSVLGKEFAAVLDGYDIPDDDLQSIVKDTMEQFKGGMLGAVFLGVAPAGLNVLADTVNYSYVKDQAERIDSSEALYNEIKDNPLFDGMSETNKHNTIKEIHEKAQLRKEERINTLAKQIAEGLDAAEGAEEHEIRVDENGEEIEAEANPVARNEFGNLEVDDEEYKDSDGNVTGGLYWAGDPSKANNNRYGYINYSQDKEGNITIENFKMADGREGLREELFDQFAREHPDTKIEWNAIGPDMEEAKATLIASNPSGAKNGLNYYTTEELNSGNIEARKKAMREIGSHIFNYTKNADGTWTKTKLTNKQLAAAVTLIESAARRMDMGLAEYISKTFGENIFGSKEDFAEASLAQGEDVNTKAGGMKQGVAQSDWRKVGQQVKAVIYAGEHADFSTWVHEMAHVFQNQLDGELKTAAEKAFNVVNGDWFKSTYTFKDGRTMSSAEAFAYAFQDWLETGKAENEQMRNIFQQFAQFLADAYNRLRKHLDFTPEIVDVFNKLLDGDDTIMSKALKAAQEQENEYRASLKRKAEEQQAAKKAEKEQAEKQAQAEREEASEGTEFTEGKSAEAQQAEAENKIREVTNETEKTDNAIDNALENTNLTDDQKETVAETLKDESSTIVDKAEATTEAAESAYKNDIPYDLFQNEGALLSQLIGEPSIRRLAEGELKDDLTYNLIYAQQLDINDKKFLGYTPEQKAQYIKNLTGWDKTANGEWKYETDDSVNIIVGGNQLVKNLKADPQYLEKAKHVDSIMLKDVLQAQELYKLVPYLKNVTVRFINDPSALPSSLNEHGIVINTFDLRSANSERGLKGLLAKEIQHVLQATESARTVNDFTTAINTKAAKLNELQDAYRRALREQLRTGKYDKEALQRALDERNNDLDEIEARNVARRVMMTAYERNKSTLESTEDVKRTRERLLSQEESPDFEEAVKKAQDLLFKNKISRILFQDEINTIRKQYENTDQWMKAPNGADSKLNEKQWLQVRTPSFKKWYGDWEKDPQNASKVLDENGEPLVVYHGSNQWFQVFNEGKTSKSSNVNTPDNTIFTNDNKEIASSFQNYYGGKVTDVILDENSPLHRKYDWGTYRAGGVYSLFMNLRNPKIVDYKGQTWKTDGMNINDEVAKAMQEGYDGFIAKNIIDVGFTDVTPPASNDYIAFNNTAVKSATDNNGNFDASNPNILFQEELDKEYEEAVNNGDTEKAIQMLQEEAERKGYNLSSDYQGTSAFNGAAPYRNGYYSTKEERLEAVKNEEFEDTATLGDYAYDNADALGFEFLIEDPRSYRAADEKRKEAIDNLRKAVNEARSGKKNVTIKMYRSVPADIKEGSFRNGDWITPSKSYAEDNADVHGWSEGEYRIIEQDVDLEHIWWDGNDIAEWGYDDEKETVYKNTENNRKLFEVTYDEKGNLIPLSKRFDDSNPSLLFQIAGEIGAENLDKSEVQEGVSRMQNLAIAQQMEVNGKDAETIRLATGWERGAEGKWKYEIDDGTLERPVDGKKWETVDGKTIQVPKLQKEGYLYEFYKNDELYKAYPDIDRVWISFVNDIPGHARTYNYGGNYHIDINEKESPEEIRGTLIHEIQHVIQDREGFAKGGSPDDFKPVMDEADLRIYKDILEGNVHDKRTKAAVILDKINKDIDADKMLEEFKPLLKSREKNIDDWFTILRAAQSKHPDWEEYKKLSDKANKDEEELNHIGQYQLDNGKWITPEEAYWRLAGEVEARNADKRNKFTPEQRRNILLAATEDVAPEDRIVLFQEVYHGSGADFDKFDTEQYGFSGEGTMSFGYGTYVTDSEEIARDYANRQGLNFDKVKITDDNRLYYDIAFNISRGFTFEDAKEKLLESTKKSIEQRRNYIERVKASKLSEEDKKFKLDYSEKRLQEDIADLEKIEKLLPSLTVEDVYNKLGIEKRRYLYTVEIPDDGYLNWKDEISVEDAIKIANQFINYAERNKLDINAKKLELPQEWSYDGTITGQDLYIRLDQALYGTGTEKTVSRFLNSIGYAGIKYPAGTIYGNGNGAYNYVIFNDDDAKIVDKLLFQTNAELMNEAQGFENWQEFMDFCETFHADDEVSPIPGDADAQWYQTFWETSNGVKTEQEKNEEALKSTTKKDTQLPAAVDALFTTMIRSDPEMVDSFLQAVADIDAIDLDSEEWQQAENAEDAAQRDKIAELKDFINITLSDYNWQTALRRIQGGHEISEGLRKRLIGEITDSFKARDFRALYAEVMGDEQYAVAPEDSITAVLNKKLKKYHDIVKPTDDVARWSPERRKQLAEQLQNRELADKIRRGDLKLDDELDAYIKSLTKQIKEKQKQFDELEAETKADYQRIADKERRDLLKLHEQLLLARGKLKTRNQEIERKIKKGLKITEKYRALTQNLNANYDEIFRKYSDLRNTITISAEVQAALDRQEQVAGLRENLNAKQKEKNLTAEVKKMRIQLVKRTMRRVPFNRVDFNNARTVIAIQRMLEPNLLGGVNRFIGIDSPYLRGVISQIVTDSEYKDAIMSYLSKNSKASQAFADFKKKIEELKSVKDFDSWTAKDRKAAIRYLPKENWVRDLNLKELAKEREESIDLDIGMEEIKRTVYDEKTGEPKTYKDNDGNTHNVTETAFRLKYDEELGRLVQDAVGADMFDKIINMPFSEWTTEDLEKLAQRIDEIYTEGRDLKAAKDEARKREAAEIRKRIEDAIKETGITINDDDTPEEKERKQKQIDKILGMSDDLKGTEAAKPKGFKAKITRLLHSYSDMNVLRFARMLDGRSEGENVRMLYRKEDDCYNAKQRSMNSRAEKIYKVMQENGITEGDLAEVVKVPTLGTEFTIDELLYFLAADKDYAEDEKKLQRGLFGIDANDDYAATSRNAVMFGNMMSDMMSQEEKESWLKLDKDMEEALQNDTLTQEQKEQLATGQLDKKPGTTRYIMACHAKWEIVLGAANNYLSTHPEYKALMEAIETDYAEQYGRMNEVSINEFNMPVHRVKAYVPLVRRESNGDTNENKVREDLLGAAGVGKQWADKGMTKRRVNISPLNQKPVQTGLFRTWGDSIERTEHFIAYAPYVRQLNAIYKSRDASYTRRFIEARYGKGAIEYLDAYINEVANPNAGRIRERGAEWLHVLRGKTAPAYLGWKASAIIKQGLTSPWPFMQFVNPAEYTAAALKFTFNPEMRDAIKEKSVFMKMRRMDPVNDLIDEMADSAKSKLDRGWSNFSKIGMQGLEMIDWACVAPGWLACYEKKYNQLQKASNARYEAKMAELKERNMYAEVGTSEYLTPQQMEAEARKEITEDIETEAVRYADDCTRQCQPSNRVTDLAPLFKNSSEAMKAFLQFQTSLNVIWQNLRYDMPYAVKNREFTRIAGTVIGYVCAGIFMNSVMDGIGGDDDDDETQALRNLIYYSTTQFTDSIPIMGSEITNTMDQLITGKRGFYGSGTDMTPSATKLLSVLTTAKKGNWQKAAELTAEGIGLYLGAPVSGVKEINKLLGKPLENGGVDLKAGVSDVYGIAGDILEE